MQFHPFLPYILLGKQTLFCLPTDHLMKVILVSVEANYRIICSMYSGKYRIMERIDLFSILLRQISQFVSNLSPPYSILF